MKIVSTLKYWYLGIALGVFANVTFNQWQFYAILIPIVILDVISERTKNK